MQSMNVTIILNDRETQALRLSANKALRKPKDQARYLLRIALGIEANGAPSQEKHNRVEVRQDSTDAVAA
jgi:hypothetical protein